MAQRELGPRHIIYTCKPTCEGNNKYSLQGGILVVSEETTKELYSMTDLLTSNLSLEPHPPICLPCPLGAKCEGSIQSLPDYWGYITQKKGISMIRCPDSYCCQDNETCEEIDF